MLPAVARAIDEIRATFPEAVVVVHEDGNGGAWFFADGVNAGNAFAPQRIWIGADISPQYPYADVYPIFVTAELRRADGTGIGEATSPNVGFHGRTSLQISRRSNHRDPGLETAAMKLQKVLAWMARKT